MSLPVTPADIASAIKLGFWVYEHYFVTENRASERYMEFGSDIRFLAKQLQNLVGILGEINERNRARSIRAAVTWDIERQELVGDFNRTIKQAKHLLEENARHNSDGFIDTMRFYTAGIEAQSNLLRDRLQFHCSKITFLIKPLELELQGRSGRDQAIIKRHNREVRKQNREQTEILRSLAGENSIAPMPSRVDQFGLISVPSNLHERYEAQAAINRPFQSSEEFPLKETRNALLYHFNESTIQAREGYVSLSQYNSLIKSRWILGKMLESSHYQRLGDCQAKTIIDDIEDEIRYEYGRFEEDWDISQAQSISSLDDSHFSIWFKEEIEPLIPAVTEEGPGEVKILHRSLPASQGYSSQSLLVFRQSDKEYRLLRTSKLEGLDYDLPSEKQMINVHHIRFIPFYAVPNTAESANSVVLCQNHQHQGDDFEFQNVQDTFEFQRALTGYSVTHSTKVRWELQRDGLFKKSVRGKGWSGLQLWEWDPLTRTGSGFDTEQTSDQTTRSSRSRSDARASTMADVATMFPTHAASILTSPNGDLGSQEIIASAAPKIPVLMLFTYLNGKLSFMHLPLEGDMGVNLERCGCLAKQSTCCHSVLEQNPGKKGKFKIKTFSVENNKNGLPLYNDWDLLIFGQPRHPAFAKLDSIDQVSWLDLELSSIDDRKRFQIAFLKCQRRYKEKLEDFGRIRHKMQALDQKPNVGTKHRTNSAGRLLSRANSIVPTSSALPEDRRTSIMSATNSSCESPRLQSMSPFRPSSGFANSSHTQRDRQASSGSAISPIDTSYGDVNSQDSNTTIRSPRRASTTPQHLSPPSNRFSSTSNSSDEYTSTQLSSPSSRSSLPNTSASLPLRPTSQLPAAVENKTLQPLDQDTAPPRNTTAAVSPSFSPSQLHPKHTTSTNEDPTDPDPLDLTLSRSYTDATLVARSSSLASPQDRKRGQALKKNTIDENDEADSGYAEEGLYVLGAQADAIRDKLGDRVEKEEVWFDAMARREGSGARSEVGKSRRVGVLRVN